MFTGLVQAVGRIAAIEERPFGVRLVVDANRWDHRPELGESISVSGVCLTLAETMKPGEPMRFDVVAETLRKTKLGALRVGSGVNLERACRPNDLLGGHIVQGHVDGVATVTSVQDNPEDWRLRVEPPADLMEFTAPKGSICIDGVSLTIAELTRAHVEVALIPTTLEKTTLHALREGDSVNLEMDAVGKQVVHWLKHYGNRQ
jgi:riboflavin synthase